MDWRGFTTLDGWINWKQVQGKKRFWLVCAYVFFFMFIIFIYVARHAFLSFNANKKGMPQPPARKGRPIAGLVTGFFVFIIVLAGSSGNASSGGTPAPAPTQHAAPIQKPTPKPIATPTPIPSPTSTPTPTAVPTQPPVQQQPTQQPAPPPPVQQPVPPPPVTGVNGNPWGYDFNPGNLIYSPNSGFCSYFNCVSTFWTATNGYVAECGNGKYTHSDGVKGACSKDSGVSQILYSH